MGQEIERKFLLANSDWKSQADAGSTLCQGYLSSTPERTVRVRIKGQQAWITIKGKSEGISRQEFEYEIPVEDAKELLLLCEKPLIEKTRYLVRDKDLTWEIDVFEGENSGLVLAEVELPSADLEISLPGWIGREVSDDPRYYNSALIKHPFSTWN